jgi:hypothetical protein
MENSVTRKTEILNFELLMEYLAYCWVETAQSSASTVDRKLMLMATGLH